VKKVITAILLASSLWQCTSTSPKETKPKLVILISVDQMRGDYIDRFNTQFSQGLRTLIDNGYNFSNTHHYHSNTTTAAGHAALSTGYIPINNGIVANNVYNRATQKWEYSVLDTTAVFEGIDTTYLKKVSYENLKKPSLGDIIKRDDSLSKSYSVSLKDRASIALGGRNANRAFWFDASSTQMVSTTHYKEPFFNWVKEFRANKVLADDLMNGWQLSDDFTPDAFTAEDFIEQEAGIFSPSFPHTLATLDSAKVPVDKEGVFIWHTPFGDKYVLEFGKKLIAEENLGADEHTDVLTLSLSSADLIGHHFGPNSYEVQDYYLKLDRYLGDFLSFLDEKVGKGNYILALSGDHGVAQFPQLAAKEGKDAQRISKKVFDRDFEVVDSLVRLELGLTKSVIKEVSYKGLEPDIAVLDEIGIDSLTLFKTLEKYIKEIPYILEVYHPFDIDNEKCTKLFINEVRNSFDIQRNTLLYLLQKENYLVDARPHGTTHGTPFWYDTHVPLLFYGAGIQVGQSADRVHTIDVAPTLLHLSGVEPYDKFDGKIILN
jgi:predicted AlkP superfamily pyrophosphatase or phosphodiesterase